MLAPMAHWTAAGEEVLLATEPALVPPSVWTPQVAAAFDWQPSILVIGRDLPSKDRALIQRTGIVDRVPSLQLGLQRMAEAQWDVIVVSPGLRDDSDGVRFVRAFKIARKVVGAPIELLELRRRYLRTPFLVQPLPGDCEFAVFQSASRWFLANTWSISLATAVLLCAERRFRS
jgi:hypothetical protein